MKDLKLKAEIIYRISLDYSLQGRVIHLGFLLYLTVSILAFRSLDFTVVAWVGIKLWAGFFPLKRTGIN